MLSLAFGLDPVLDSPGLTAEGIGNQSDVTGRIDPRRRGLEALVHGHGPVFEKPAVLQVLHRGLDSDADHDQLRLQGSAVVENHRLDLVRAADLPGRAPQVEVDSVLLVERLQAPADGLCENPAQGQVLRGDHVDLQAPGAQGSRGFQPDEARPENHGPGSRVRCRGRRCDQGVGVTEAAQHEYTGERNPGDRQAARHGSSGQQDRIGPQGFAVGKAHASGGLIEGRHPPTGEHLDLQASVELLSAQGQPLGRGLAAEVVLGEHGAVIGKRILGTYHDDPAAETLPPQGLRRGVAGRPGADDQEGAGVRAFGHRDGSLAGLAHVHRTGFDLDLVARQIVQARGCKHPPVTDIETGIVRGAGHHVAREQPVGQRSMIVAALVAAGIDPAPGTDEQNLGAFHLRRHCYAFNELLLLEYLLPFAVVHAHRPLVS